MDFTYSFMLLFCLVSVIASTKFNVVVVVVVVNFSIHAGEICRTNISGSINNN